MGYHVLILAILALSYAVYAAFWGDLVKKWYELDMMVPMPKDLRSFTIVFRTFMVLMLLATIVVYVLFITGVF